jgi:hypothetical protein
MSNDKFNKYDLNNRLYPITKLIQKVAVKRNVLPALIRDELLAKVDITVGMLSQLEGAFIGQKKPPKLQPYQGNRMNIYFRAQLVGKETYFAQADIQFAEA